MELEDPAARADKGAHARVGDLSSVAVLDLDSRGPITKRFAESLRGNISVSADGKRLAVNRTDQVTVFDAVTLEQVWETPVSALPTAVLPLLSPSGDLVAVNGVNTVELREVGSGRKLLGPVPAFSAWPTFSPDGRWWAVMSFGRVLIYDLSTMTVSSSIVPRTSDSLATELTWSPDSTQLAITSVDEPTRLVDARGGPNAADVTIGPPGSQVRWSADASTIAVFDDVGRSHLIDARTHDVRRTVVAARQPVSIARWFANDSRLAWVRLNDNDGAVLEIADTATGQPIGPPVVLTGPGLLANRSGGFTSDGRLLVGPVGEPVLEVVLDPAMWADRACAVAGRDLTQGEWAAYLGSIGSWRSTCGGSPTSTQ